MQKAYNLTLELDRAINCCCENKPSLGRFWVLQTFKSKYARPLNVALGLPMTDKPSVEVDSNLQNEDILRRYMDLPKYLDLLRSKTLYLRRADGFSDRFEGALTPIFRKSFDESYAKGEIEYDADYFYRRSRTGSFVSCWSLGADDNMALWQLYGGVSNSVAVMSTLDKIIDMALGWQTNVLIEKVKYIDHFKNPNMIIGRYTDVLQFKHEAYEYEEEVRIIVPKQDEGWERNPMSLRMSVSNIESLIQSVIVAPEAGTWFYELVKDLSRKYNISAPIIRSKLTTLPE